MKFAVVVPAYNESRHIGKVLREIKKHIDFIIVVDDGSRDNTSEIVQKEGVLIVRHRINLGKGAALKTGTELAFKKGADAIIMLDSDGQHNPDDIPRFIKEIQKGYDVVIGSRKFDLGVPLVRFLGNKFASVIINICFGIYVGDLLCGFRAFTKKAYKSIRWKSARYGVETEMVARIGRNKLKFSELPVESIYLDKYKGVTILDAISVLFHIPEWRFL